MNTHHVPPSCFLCASLQQLLADSAASVSVADCVRGITDPDNRAVPCCVVCAVFLTCSGLQGDALHGCQADTPLKLTR